MEIPNHLIWMAYTANYFPAHIAGFPRVILSPHNVPAISTTNTRILVFPTYIATFGINCFYQQMLMYFSQQILLVLEQYFWLPLTPKNAGQYP